MHKYNIKWKLYNILFLRAPILHSEEIVFNLWIDIMRRRWFSMFVILIGGVSIITFMIHIHYNGKKQIRDTYMDDFSKANYEYVIRKWYNFTGADMWYNKKKYVSMIDGDLLFELRNHWLVYGSINNETYYRGLSQPEVMDPSMGQAAVIKEIFNNKKNGFFIECGAYDGETRSNTLTLERYLNWTGILIEADPINFSKLLSKNRRAHLSPTCLSIEPRPMRTSFLMSRNIGRIHKPENSSDMKHTNSPDVAHHGHHITVQCFPLMSFIAAFKFQTIHYLSLDVEGNEMDILETIPFDSVDIKTLSVEYSHVNKSREYMIKYMENRGYYVYSFVNHADNLANDVIFVKKSKR